MYKSLTNNAPAYIDDLLKPYNPPRKLRSYNSSLLIEPISNHSWGDRSFSHAAPRLWNKLPALVKSSVSLTQFKKNLKTHLFNQVFEKMVWFLPFDVFFDIAFVLYFSSTCSGFLLSLGLRFNFGYCTCKYYSLYLAPWALWWICVLYKFSLLLLLLLL